MFAAFASVVVGPSGCSSSTEGDAEQSDLAATRTEPMTYSLPGVNETLLVAALDGKMELLAVGERSTKRRVSRAPATRPVAAKSFGGAFYVLYANGKIARVDRASAAATVVARATVPNAADLVVAGADAAYVASGGDGKLLKVHPGTGAVLASLDLSSSAMPMGTVSLRQMLLVGGRLLVQVRRQGADRRPQRGAVAVVDPSDLQLREVVELRVPDPKDASLELDGLQPGGPMVLDEEHSRVFVTALGARPSDTGLLLSLELATSRLSPWVKLADAGFQGPVALGAAGPERKFYVSYHTSTPVASTHLFDLGVDASGLPLDNPEGQRALVDVFEEIGAFASSASRSHFAFGISCPAGFCIGGAGIAFVETASAKVLPRLPAAELGIAPALVVFQ